MIESVSRPPLSSIFQGVSGVLSDIIITILIAVFGASLRRQRNKERAYMRLVGIINELERDSQGRYGQMVSQAMDTFRKNPSEGSFALRVRVDHFEHLKQVFELEQNNLDDDTVQTWNSRPSSPRRGGEGYIDEYLDSFFSNVRGHVQLYEDTHSSRILSEMQHISKLAALWLVISGGIDMITSFVAMSVYGADVEQNIIVRTAFLNPNIGTVSAVLLNQLSYYAWLFPIALLYFILPKLVVLRSIVSYYWKKLSKFLLLSINSLLAGSILSATLRWYYGAGFNMVRLVEALGIWAQLATMGIFCGSTVYISWGFIQCFLRIIRIVREKSSPQNQHPKDNPVVVELMPAHDM
jgi:hypothetical protein